MPQAQVMCIGEAPGRDEDIQGKPFVGRSGQLLDRMLAAIGLSRQAQDPADAVFITNVIFWRPPGNRTPTEQETLMCLPFLRRIIEILSTANPRRRRRHADPAAYRAHRWHPEIARQVVRLRTRSTENPLLATLHPAYLLRQPAQKRLAWRDLLCLAEARSMPIEWSDLSSSSPRRSPSTSPPATT